MGDVQSVLVNYQFNIRLTHSIQVTEAFKQPKCNSVPPTNAGVIFAPSQLIVQKLSTYSTRTSNAK